MALEPIQKTEETNDQFNVSFDDVMGEFNKINPSNNLQALNFEQFAQPYETYMNKLWEGQTGKLNQNLKDTASQLSQEIYGQNVGAGSGIGTDKLNRFLQTQTDQLAPYAQELTGQYGLQALSDYMNQQNLAGKTTTGLQTLDAQKLDESKRQANVNTLQSLREYEQGVSTQEKAIEEDTRRYELERETQAQSFLENIRQFDVQSEERAAALTEEKRKFDTNVSTQLKQMKESTRQYEQNFSEEQRRFNEQTAQAEADKLFSLVNNGQISGAEAENVLKQQGFNPEYFMTTEQLKVKLESDELDRYKKNLPQEIATTISTMDEFQHYIEFGRTYEDEVAEIIETSKSLEEWKAKIPTIEAEVKRLNEQLEGELRKSGNWAPWDKPDEGRIANYKEKIAELEQVINEVRAGKVPVVEV